MIGCLCGCLLPNGIAPTSRNQISTTKMVQVARRLRATLERYAVSVPDIDAQVKAMVRTINCPGGPWDIGVMLTTNDQIQRLNNKYRNKNRPTDILSFPAHKITRPGRFPVVYRREDRYLGDIYISLPYVQGQCEDPDVEDVLSLETRMPILLAHGICHLLGYDHETDSDYERMAKAEAYILRRYQSFLGQPGMVKGNQSNDAT